MQFSPRWVGHGTSIVSMDGGLDDVVVLPFCRGGQTYIQTYMRMMLQWHLVEAVITAVWSPLPCLTALLER
jgi:hypothetical protein